MALADFLDKVGTGDVVRRDLKEMTKIGRDTLGRGFGISDEGLAGLRKSIGDYEGMLASGRPLPASVYRAFEQLRGGIKDESARSMASVRESIAQRRASTGGMMSAEAAAELARMGERDVRGKAFDTMRDVDVAEANQILQATQDLFGRLDEARGRILNHGEFTQKLGSEMYQNAAMTRLKRNHAIFSTAASFFGGRR